MRVVCGILAFLIVTWAMPARADVTAIRFRPGTQVTVESGHIEYYRSTNLYLARDGVTIRYGNNLLTADEVAIDRNNRIFTATGNVYLTDGQSEMRSERIVTHLDDNTGIILGGQLLLRESGYRISGTRIEKVGEEEYEVENGTLTTCDCGDDSPSWSVSAGYIHVEVGGYALVRNALFYVKKVPVMYLPIGYFPVKTEREFGLLLPQLRYTGSEGLVVRQGLFIPLGDTADATVWADYYSMRGIGGSSEFRYLGREGSYGKTDFRYLYQLLLDPSESGYRAHRFTLDSTNRHNFSELEALVVDLHALSDRQFNADLGQTLAEKTKPFVRSEIAYLRAAEGVSLLAKADSYARSDLAALGVFNRLPHIELLSWPRRLWSGGPVLTGMLGFDHIMSRPSNSDIWEFGSYEPFGDRADLTARLEQPLTLGPLLATPLAAGRATVYRTAATEPVVHRELGALGLRLETPFDRAFYFPAADTTATDLGLRHRITPQARYRFTPGSDVAPFSFDELDQIEPRNLIEYGLANQLYWWRSNSLRSSGVAELGLYQHYSLRETTEPRLSPILARLLVQFPNRLQLSTRLYYDPALDREQLYHSVYRVDGPVPGGFTAGVEYHNLANYVVSDRTRVVLDDEIDSSYVRRTDATPWASREIWGYVTRTFFERILLSYGTRYSIDQRLFLESIYGFSYRSFCDCWSVGGRFIQRPNSDLSFNLTFTLVGVGSVGY